MENAETGHERTHVPGDDRTHEPGDHQGKEGGTSTLGQLDEEHVRTQEQRNQSWTAEGQMDPRRDTEGEPFRHGTDAAPPLDRPEELKEKMDDVMSHPHSDAQDTSDTQGGHGDLGGMPRTGSGEQDPMRQAQGSGSE